MSKVLITGITGFAGSYLAKLLVDSGNNVAGTYLSDASLANVEDIKEKLDLVKINLLEKDSVEKLISEKRPDIIYHLAALTSPADSFKNPSETITNNIAIQLNIFDAVKNAKLDQAKILITSSAEIYGLVKVEDLPINENTILNPTSPYAVSKIAQDYLGLQYFLTYKLQIIRVRPFNHVGPKQAPNFVISAFAKKIADIEKGNMEPVLRVGNLDAKRDFTDVRDMVKAYFMIMEKGKAGEVYNIGSGTSHAIKDILDKLLGFSSSKINVETDESLLRPLDNPELVCDNTKIENATNWKAEIPLETTLKDTLDYWRSIV